MNDWVKEVHKFFIVPIADIGLDSDLLVKVTMYCTVEPLQVKYMAYSKRWAVSIWNPLQIWEPVSKTEFDLAEWKFCSEGVRFWLDQNRR